MEAFTEAMIQKKFSALNVKLVVRDLVRAQVPWNLCKKKDE